MAAAAVSASAAVRLTMATAAPASASAWAIAYPNPRLPPVTIATRSSNRKWSSTGIIWDALAQVKSLRGSLRSISAVYHQHCARDKACVVGCEEQEELRDLLGLCDAPNRVCVAEALHEGVRIAGFGSGLLQ